jgi:hypothetical protein
MPAIIRSVIITDTGSRRMISSGGRRQDPQVLALENLLERIDDAGLVVHHEQRGRRRAWIRLKSRFGLGAGHPFSLRHNVTGAPETATLAASCHCGTVPLSACQAHHGL